MLPDMKHIILINTNLSCIVDTNVSRGRAATDLMGGSFNSVFLPGFF